MEIIGRISTYIVISGLFVILSILLKSPFLSEFLIENIVIILITLLAINTATYGFIVAKIDDLSEKINKNVFTNAIAEIKKSLLIQLYLIASAIIVSILARSKLVVTSIHCSQEITDFLLLFIFVFALDLLRDTGLAIFELRTSNIKSKD